MGTFEKMYDVDPAAWLLGAAVVFYEDEEGRVEVDVDLRLPEVEGVIFDYDTPSLKCDHCGKSIRHFVLLKERDGQERIIRVGWTCYRETFAHADARALSMHRAKKRAERQAFNAARDAARDVYLEAHKELVHFLEEIEGFNSFAYSLLGSIDRWGKLTPNQEKAAYKMMAKHKKRQEEDGEVSPAPDGKGITVVGVVVHEGWKDNPFAYNSQRHVMTVKSSDGGWRTWGSVPSDINMVEEGDRVQFVANLERSADDETFAFFKRPRKARVTGNDLIDDLIVEYLLEDVQDSDGNTTEVGENLVGLIMGKTGWGSYSASWHLREILEWRGNEQK